MKKQILILSLLTVTLFSCADIKSAGRTVGHTSRDVTKEIGHTTKDVATEIGHASRDAVKSIGEELKNN